MRNLLKYAGIAVLVAGLAACDGKNDKAAASQDASSSQSAQNVTLMGGKLGFALPPGMSDKSGKLGTQANNKHVYADESGQKAIIVIEGGSTSEGLDTLAERLEAQQRSRDPQLQVVTNKTIGVNNLKLQQLDSVISANNQSSWSSVVLGKIDGKLMTLQITLPANNQQQAQIEAESIINSITLK
ncbi:DcrB family lipoprotein [Erwinia amylovora]|uniref:DcrB family lipoprotein n=1 Tax=Erwinia amylovora TaxID=552 RepID=UPI0002CB8C8D|nr:DcrB family lipoprotein [Erwinia amylovora]CCP08859.1 Protein dcrB precursor [Erwinia amylovora MR1]